MLCGKPGHAIAKNEAASFMRPAREVLLVVADRHRRSVERNTKRASGSSAKVNLDESATTLPALAQPKSLAPLVPLFHAGLMSASAELREVCRYRERKNRQCHALLAIMCNSVCPFGFCPRRNKRSPGSIIGGAKLFHYHVIVSSRCCDLLMWF